MPVLTLTARATVGDLRLTPRASGGRLILDAPDSVAAFTLYPFVRGESGEGGGAPYVHVQTVPAVTWTVNHNQGIRPASPTVYTTGWVEIDALLTHTSENQIVVQFNTAQSGFLVF